MENTLEQIAREWQRISGRNALPRLNSRNYHEIIAPALEKGYSNDLEAYESPVIGALIDSEMNQRFQERSIKDLSDPKELLQSYEVVTDMNIESFGYQGRGFNHSIFDKMDREKSKADKIIQIIKKELGLKERTISGLSRICTEFAPEKEDDFKSEDKGYGGIFLENNSNLKKFVEEIYPQNKKLYDSLANIQESLYDKAKKVSQSYAMRLIPLSFLRPLVIYAKQHQIVPYSEGGIRGRPSWDIKEVFSLKEDIKQT